MALLIDEIQYFGQKEPGALLMAMHKVQQRKLPLLLLGDGSVRCRISSHELLTTAGPCCDGECA